MWKRKELKDKAKKVVKNNYWTAIIVCFLIALFTGEFGTSILGMLQSEDSMDPNYIYYNELVINNDNTDKEKVEEQMEKVDAKKESINAAIENIPEQILQAIDDNLNSVTKSQKYIFKIWDAIEYFSINQKQLGVVLFIAGIVAYLFTVVIADPLIVGGKRFFIKARKKKNTKIGTIIEVFKNGNWFNVVIIMFLRNIYNALWYLTIIGGIIKTYEYRMIPYILAENPKIKRKKAFELSKQMMKGNKWKTFILDISFFGWYLLSVLTLGLLSILWVNPYNTATITELYMTLRKQAINEKYQYYEELNGTDIK